MSSAHIPLMNALMAAMQGDTVITGALAADPANSNRAAIFLGRFNDLKAPVYPCVTFRTSMATANKHFEDAAPNALTAPIDEFRVDFEVWMNAPGSTIIAVLDELQVLFRNTAFSLTGGGLSTSNANMFRGSLLTYMPDGYDPVQQKWFGIASYYFRVQR